MKPARGLGKSIWAPGAATRRSGSSSGTHNSSDERQPKALSKSLPPSRLEGAAAAASPSKTPPAPPSPKKKTSSTATTTPAAGTSSELRIQSFRRFEQTCHRLRWKFIDLQSSYDRALRPLEWKFTAQDAERNFKVDFHEFYAWIEQALVFLLRIFGVTVERAGWGGGAGGARRGGGFSSSSSSSHAYHHNVLKTLEDKRNPLHGTLGRGTVIEALWKAKELRNRWKDAAEGKETPPLKLYDLRWIVASILGGLEEAYGLAGREVVKGSDLGLGREERSEGGEEDGWEWMVEMMDWEPDGGW
ncbi:hypothetical protein E4U57_003421 [Claviceps arundinis]|uniref:Fungal specific transcription factor n=1 Tax=Claviceps arundinis TaxID=1623583 RepID=A0A9P7SNN0_9HYPO|nr:hypothetical protein E4U57_003421 [Claviceps arundinis]KAG5961760.1 hypothetical protein E4U56_003747 [Claviceps arundinis]